MDLGQNVEETNVSKDGLDQDQNKWELIFI